MRDWRRSRSVMAVHRTANDSGKRWGYARGMTMVAKAVGLPLGDRVRLIAADIKLAHSVFALPFAVLGAFLARTGEWPGNRGFAVQLLLIVVCMVCARTWAMLFNRLADRRIDAANPR